MFLFNINKKHANFAKLQLHRYKSLIFHLTYNGSTRKEKAPLNAIYSGPTRAMQTDAVYKPIKLTFQFTAWSKKSRPTFKLYYFLDFKVQKSKTSP